MKRLKYLLIVLVGLMITGCHSKNNVEIEDTSVMTTQENIYEEKEDENSSDSANSIDNTIDNTELETHSNESQSDFQIEENIFDKDVSHFFTNYQEGSFVLKYADTNSGIVYNEPLTEIQRSPLSTFKVLSSLIILEEQLVSDINQVINWDQTVYQVADWNGDQTLSTAFKYSVVWVYERLLAKLDKNTMASYVEEANYGNKDISAEGDFWLDSSLKISLKEQVLFLENLYYNRLDFNEDNINTVKEMMLTEETENYKIYGKTGSDADGAKLYVGFIEAQGGVYFFGTYVKEENASYNVAKDITYKIADELFGQ
ncbi:MAG: penicillin-binding transpeptidase domain-containing protein [Lachnotalea sp.]